MSFIVRKCSDKAARYACEHFHYSRSLPMSKRACYGVWEGKFIGSIIFAHGANHRLGSPFGLSNLECCELVRVALSKHQAPVSQILSVAVRLLKRDSPGVRLIVSYADQQQGHIGTIYQAAGWNYLGETSAGFAWVVHGRIFHKRAFTGKNYGGPVKRIPTGAVKIRTKPKHRYARALDRETQRVIDGMSSAYPKRAESIENDAPADQAGEGGATPTSALHS